jgi:uncharacterized protein YceK
MKRVLAMILAAQLLTGCSTIISKTAGDDDGKFYSGVYCQIESTGEINAIVHELGWPLGIVVATMILIDLPLSFVADTVYLPIDAYHFFSNTNSQKKLPFSRSYETPSCFKFKM